MRDQLYPVKVDGAKRMAVIDENGDVLPGAAEVLGEENEVSIGKIRWISRRDSGKAYGSMVVYVSKRSDAMQLLQDQYCHVGGESGSTGVYEPRYGLKQCFRRQ